MNREYTGGLFWDILLITEYNEDWINFYHSLIKVLPCDKCREETLLYHKTNELPIFNNTTEKNKWLWDFKLKRGGTKGRAEIIENNYTLESWEGLFKDLPFTKY